LFWKEIGVATLLFCILAIDARADEKFANVAAFLEQHCHECHGPDVQEAGLRLDKLDAFCSADTHLWTDIYVKLATGEMPPKDQPAPSAAQKQKLLAWIEAEQSAIAASSLRRLNRRELSAALRDVTGLAVDYAQGLPGDGRLAGFDTGAEALTDAADSVARLMNVTRRAVDAIRFLDPPSGKVLTADLISAKDPKKTLDEWKAAGATAKGSGTAKAGMGWLLTPSWVGDRDSFSIRLPAANRRTGVLRLELVVSAYKPVAGLPNSRLWIEVGNRDFDYVEITGTAEAPQRLVYEIQLDDLAIDSKGLSIQLSNKVELPYTVAGFENDDRSNPEKPVPGGTGLFRPAFDRKQVKLEEQPVPFVAIHKLEIDPDYVAAWPPAEWKLDQGEIRDDEASAERLLHAWTQRAWRRPVTRAEESRFLELYRQVRKEGQSFDAALRAAFQSVLLSAPFRYLAAPKQEDETESHYAIASRLSFLLTGEPPDAELLRLAEKKQLRDPAVLDAQVDRLLTDARAEGFVRPFVLQWLEAEQPITLVMTSIQKQDFRFGRYLKASMREETIAYIKQLFVENRPAKEIVSSNWTMMNDSLAIHYGYAGVTGGQMRKVELRADDPRGGGILGHAGIQSMLCWMGDNWVIYRGAWTLRHILDRPPPPPPLEVPELVPSDAANRGKSFRELLKQHQEDQRCSICHKHIDPLGFAFQNFDISGRWRDVEHERYVRNELDGKIEWNGAGATRPVDAAGRLPRGEEFTTFQDFKSLVATKYQPDLVRGLLKNLVVYAAGRRPDVQDMKAIETILAEQKSTEYRMRDLMKAVLRSKLFLDR
jgi:hypothetical protein